MKKVTTGISSAIQWFIAVLLGLAAIGAFMDSVVAGIFMLLATILICPLTRGSLNNFVKKKTTKVKGWMYGVAAFLFILMATSGGTEATTDEMPVRSQVNNVVESNEIHAEEFVDDEISEFEENLLVELVESSEVSEHYEECIESSETKEPEEITNDEILPIEQIEESVARNTTEENESKIEETLFEEIDSANTTVDDGEEFQNTKTDSSATRVPSAVADSISEDKDSSITGAVPVTDNSSPGAYAVNGKNGKIHIVGDCSATGNGDNAMTNPKYFDTYEEAEACSVSIKPSLEKRRCGNCWR